MNSRRVRNKCAGEFRDVITVLDTFSENPKRERFNFSGRILP